MSIEAVAWVLNHGNPGDATSKLIMIGLANHADPEGTNAFPRWQRLAQYANVSRATIHRRLTLLEEHGWIRRADNQDVSELAKVPEHQRPVVYELVMEHPTPAELAALNPDTPSQVETGGEDDTPSQVETSPVSDGDPIPSHSSETSPVSAVRPHNRPSTVLSQEGGVGTSPRTPASSTSPHPPITDLEHTRPPAADVVTGEVLAPTGWTAGRLVDNALSPASPGNVWQDLGGSRSPLEPHEVPRQYPERCLTHQSADWAPPCQACAAAKRTVREAESAANAAIERARRDELTAASDARRRDIEHCSLCDDVGYLPGVKGEIPSRVCAHDADENDRRHRGLAAARRLLAAVHGTAYEPDEETQP